MNKSLRYICLGVFLGTTLWSRGASATQPPQIEASSSDGRVVVATNQRTYMASGVFSSPDCLFQFATDLRSASVDVPDSDRSLAGAAWLPGRMDNPVAVTIHLRFLDDDSTKTLFAFDDAQLNARNCADRSAHDFVEYKGQEVQGVSVTRRRTATRLDRDGAFVDGADLERNDIVLMVYSTSEHSTAPEKHVNTTSGVVLEEDLYPVITPDALKEFYLRSAR